MLYNLILELHYSHIINTLAKLYKNISNILTQAIQAKSYQITYKHYSTGYKIIAG